MWITSGNFHIYMKDLIHTKKICLLQCLLSRDLQGEFPQSWQRNNILFYLMTGILLHHYESGSSQQKGYFFSSQHIDCCSQIYPQFLHFTVWTNIYISYPPPPLQKKTRKVFYVLLIINFGDLLFGRIEILD